jgi:glycosyltransferase involved in cell wall biosynthesis
MTADYFDFGVDFDVYKPKTEQAFAKKKKILFYARAHTERRGFEIGVFALQIFKEKHPEYEIVFVGQDTSDYDIPFDYTDLGILTYDELPALYHEHVACLVLSLTNVSLLPLELLAAGCVPVMNSGENNTMVLGDVEGIEYTDAYPTSLADKLCQVVERTDITEHAKRISESVKDKSWQRSYQKVEEIILREVTTNE